MPRLSFAAVFVAASLTTAMPAAAQDSGEKVSIHIVYGKDSCPPPESENEISVCARKDESERFRIPEALRESESPENRAWTDRVAAVEMVGRSGTLSCSPVGPGGFTGCVNKLIGDAYGEKNSDPNIRFSELIAAERAKRLATIDQEAAETQARVEQLEKEYAARKRAEQNADQANDPAPPPLPLPK